MVCLLTVTSNDLERVIRPPTSAISAVAELLVFTLGSFATFKMLSPTNISTNHAHLEEGEEWMFIWSIDVDLHRQFKVGLEAMTRSDIFETVKNFRSVGARFFL